MGEELYDEEVARHICAQIELGDYFDVRADGVFVKKEFVYNDPGERVFSWIPACAMEGWPGAPNPLICPALPIPFTARDLAAFMLTNVGSIIQEIYGRIGCAPNEVALERLGMRATKVRMALRSAYDLARQAQSVVGALDHDEQQRAHDLLAAYGDALDQALEREKVMERVIVGRDKNGNPEYADLPRDEYLNRLARAKKPIADQEAYAAQVGATADAALASWRTAMVHQLFRDQEVDTKAPSPAPAVPLAEIDYGMLATSKQLIEAFGAFTGMDKSWFAKLEDKPELLAARAVRGRSGRAGWAALFYPFTVMMWLIDPKRKTGRPINEATAWRMLKAHFPKVYAAHLDCDPNTD